MLQTKVPSCCRKLETTKPSYPDAAVVHRIKPDLQLPLPGKPSPPLSLSVTPMLLPNYMKSTSSSNARKEPSIRARRSDTIIITTPRNRMMSSGNSKTASTSTITSGNNRKPKSSSSSLKLVKKTPSFKPTETVLLGADTNNAPDRPTCSSTLKDSKFPKDLTLHPKGTSAMKVCPYTYCSLNGCHRRSPPLPPLKCFISSRRRAIDLHDDLPVSIIEVDDDDMPKSVVDEVGSKSSDMDLDGGWCDSMFEIVEAVGMPEARKPVPEDQDAGGTRVHDVIDCSTYHQYEEVPRIEDDTRSIGNGDSIMCKKRLSEEEETEIDQGRFNPGEPNYLPIVPEPEAEKVDLRHQTIDERRNSDEWMIDYALRQTVTRLDPAARKRKVSLLVEAFEKVMPVPKANASRISKWETTILTSPRQIQACS